MFLILRVFILSLIMSSFAFAASSSKQMKLEQKSESKIQKPNAFKEWLKQRVSVSIFFATADLISSEGYSSNASSGWSSISSSPSFGVATQLTAQVWQKASLYANASIEQEHELSSIKTGTQAGVQTLSFNSKPGFRSFVLGGGLLLQPHQSDKYYYSIGLNYPLLTDSHAGDLSSFNVHGEIGWQILAAMRLKKEISVEAGWRDLHYNAQATKKDGTNMQFGSQRFGGFSISGRYFF